MAQLPGSGHMSAPSSITELARAATPERITLRLAGTDVLEAALDDHQETWKLVRSLQKQVAELRVEIEALQVRYEGRKLGEGPCT